MYNYKYQTQSSYQETIQQPSTGKVVVAKRKKLKINWKNVRALILVLTISALILTTIITVITEMYKDNRDFNNLQYAKVEEYVVHHGDTLWGIAEELDFENVDIREVVYKIKKMNGLESSDLYLGQELLIPVPSK
jgi:LysM repeat protein